MLSHYILNKEIVLEIVDIGSSLLPIPMLDILERVKQSWIKKNTRALVMFMFSVIVHHALLVFYILA